MGTLTAGQPRLAEYCVHKLPTSCRLSSIPECCACADERGHAAAYSTYIDGVGYVLRGSRWQRYCWFCKEFWENRVRASGLSHAQTRIPENPDQTAFLDRWYEFHQGYRTILKEDGTEERISVVGEDFGNVSPGCMPRTTEELRQGREASAFNASEDTIRATAITTAEIGPSLDDQLDQLFENAAAEQTIEPSRESHSNSNGRGFQQVTAARGNLQRSNEYHARRIAALRRELQRMRNGIERVTSGLRELGDNVPNQSEATERLETLGRTLDDISGPLPDRIAQLTETTSESNPANTDRIVADMQARIMEASAVAGEARRMRDQAASELEAAQQEVQSAQTRLRQLQLEERSMANYIRIFGTREDIIAQGDAYESPIGGMFDLAWERFRVAEQTRQETRTLRRVLEDEHAHGGEERMRRLVEWETRARDAWGVPQPRPSSENEPAPGIIHQDTSDTTQLMELARDEVFAGQSLQSQESTDVDELAEHRSLHGRSGEAHHRHNLEEHIQDDLARPAPPESNITVAPPVSTYELTRVKWLLDVTFMLTRIATSRVTSAYTSSIQLDQDRARAFLDELSADALGTNLSEEQRSYLNSLFADDEIVWATALPTEWFRRAREQDSPLWFSSNPASEDREEQRQNVEAMAQAWTMGIAVRSLSTLTAPEQLRMLYRLQRGDRTAEDRRILWMMLNMNDALEAARQVWLDRASDGQSQRYGDLVAALNRHRQRAARDRDASRATLNNQRQETRSVALAAGRMAMRAGASGVMERMIEMEHEVREQATRTEIEGLHLPTSRHLRTALARQSQDDGEGDEEDDAMGLDAKDSDRPEAKDDEEMTIKLECRICYSQFAEIACLPCGHLVMCKWCSDQHSPTMKHDRTRPRLQASCPICRKNIKQKVRVFRA